MSVVLLVLAIVFMALTVNEAVNGGVTCASISLLIVSALLWGLAIGRLVHEL